MARGQHEGDYDTKQHLMANRESSLKESSGGGVPQGGVGGGQPWMEGGRGTTLQKLSWGSSIEVNI